MCHEAFGPEAAQEVFERLSAQAGADGCTLADLRTEQMRMRIRWTKHGRPLPEAQIDAVGCSAVLSSPPELSAACPDALSAMSDAVRAHHLPTAYVRPAYSRSFALTAWLGVALALLGAMVVVLKELRCGTPET